MLFTIAVLALLVAWNVIYPKQYLDKDPNYFKTHVVGSGPFKFESYTHGSTFEGERNPDYFITSRWSDSRAR